MIPMLIAEDGGTRQHQQRLRGLIKNTQGAVRVASPYVTDRTLLSDIKNRKVYLLTSLTPMDIISGATSIEILQLLIKSGVECRNLLYRSRLHAKVYIFGNSSAVVTSANLTRNAFHSNIEVGIQIDRGSVQQLKTWFDKFWEKAHPLSISQLKTLQEQTAALRRDYFKLKMKSKSKLSIPKNDDSPAVFSEDLYDLIDNAHRFFVCNTDRRQGERTPTGKFVLEEKMCDRGYATAWETFKFPSHMRLVEPGDAIFMFAKGVGIIGIGRAMTKYETLTPGDPNRIRNFRTGNTPEWRVQVDWLDWREDDESYHCKAPNFTFWDVTSDQYSALRAGIRQHFLG
ncbi:MAG: phospholipase D family protein [Syntrophus sp. (in: bacteria)]